MRKIVLLCWSTFFCTQAGFGQLSKGGIPLGMQNNVSENNIPAHQYPSPSYDQALDLQKQLQERPDVPRPYVVALNVPLNISFPESGIFSQTKDGRMIWSTVIQIPGAKGIGLYYDHFQLPEGVRYYLSNDNGNQLIGAYTRSNNQPSGLFAHEPVQGDRIHLELDIDTKVKLETIQLHINKAAFYFRGIDYLAQYSKPDDAPQLLGLFDTLLYGRNSICMIDAKCPLGKNYFNQQRSVLSIVIPDETGDNYGMCTATMINSVGNPTTGCKSYLITASHCDYSNSTDKDRFDQALFRFNYERPCNTNTIPEANTLLGAFFISRSAFDTVNYTIKGDFLLLRLMETIPAAWNITLAGWNRDTAVAQQETAPRKFISFHHPLADVKKVSAGHMISSTNFSIGVTEQTHWNISFDSGYVDAGSSGAGLFDGDGYMIGVLTGAKGSEVKETCNFTVSGDTMEINLHSNAYYSKIGYNWDGTDTISKKLQPWLDPLQTGVLKLNGVKANCTDMDTVNTLKIPGITLDDYVTVYPNPATHGNVNIRFNMPSTSNIALDILDINGKRIRSYQLNHVTSGTYRIEAGTLSNGVYLLRISDGYSVSNKKIIIQY